jgi:hypothetical protein
LGQHGYLRLVLEKNLAVQQILVVTNERVCLSLLAVDTHGYVVI